MKWWWKSVDCASSVQAAGVAGIGMEHLSCSVLVEHADPGSLVARKFFHVEVVVHRALRQLLGRKGNVEILVEIVSERRYPFEFPPHPFPESLELVERRFGDCNHGYVPVVEMNDDTVEIIGPERAALARLAPVRTEHEEIHDELAAGLEEIGQGLLATEGIEDIILFDPDPGQFPALAGEFVAQARELLLLAQQPLASSEPLLARHY